MNVRMNCDTGSERTVISDQCHIDLSVFSKIKGNEYNSYKYTFRGQMFVFKDSFCISRTSLSSQWTRNTD